MDEVKAPDRMYDIPVSDAEKLKDNRENPPPRLLVIVGEPFGEEHMPAITRKIAAGLSPSIGNFSTFLGDTFVFLPARRYAIFLFLFTASSAQGCIQVTTTCRNSGKITNMPWWVLTMATGYD